MFPGKCFQINNKGGRILMKNERLDGAKETAIVPLPNQRPQYQNRQQDWSKSPLSRIHCGIVG